jgi:uncharacterized OB-fold protein
MSPVAGGRSMLNGTRCPACGRVATPPEPYGCEQCGALVDTLEVVELAAVGTVHGTATVHRHHRPDPPTPFTVVEVVLDAGPALKGVLAAGSDPVAIGDRVEGVVLDGRLVLEKVR